VLKRKVPEINKKIFPYDLVIAYWEDIVGSCEWSDITDIAILLEEKYPNEDNVNLRFTDLHRWVVNLNEFIDNPDASNEKILEAIQMAWIDERD